MIDELIEPRKRPLKARWLHIRLEKNEREELNRIAEQYGLSTSDLARQLLTQSIKLLRTRERPKEYLGESFNNQKHLPRNYWLHIRIEETGREEIDTLAQKCNLRKSKLVRQLILRAIEQLKIKQEQLRNSNST